MPCESALSLPHSAACQSGVVRARQTGVMTTLNSLLALFAQSVVPISSYRIWHFISRSGFGFRGSGFGILLFFGTID